MQAKVMSGPYEGRTLDHNDLNLYCTFFPVGSVQFFVMPPIEHWDDVTHERMSKDGPFSGQSAMYWLERRPPDYFALHHDETGQVLATAQQLERDGIGIPAPFKPKGLTYECVPAAEIPDEANWLEIADEKDRVWRYRVQPREFEGNVMPGLPPTVFHFCAHYAESLDDLRRSLGDLLDRHYQHPKD